MYVRELEQGSAHTRFIANIIVAFALVAIPVVPALAVLVHAIG